MSSVMTSGEMEASSSPPSGSDGIHEYVTVLGDTEFDEFVRKTDPQGVSYKVFLPYGRSTRNIPDVMAASVVRLVVATDDFEKGDCGRFEHVVVAPHGARYCDKLVETFSDGVPENVSFELKTTPEMLLSDPVILDIVGGRVDMLHATPALLKRYPDQAVGLNPGQILIDTSHIKIRVRTLNGFLARDVYAPKMTSPITKASLEAEIARVGVEGSIVEMSLYQYVCYLMDVRETLIKGDFRSVVPRPVPDVSGPIGHGIETALCGIYTGLEKDITSLLVHPVRRPGGVRTPDRTIEPWLFRSDMCDSGMFGDDSLVRRQVVMNFREPEISQKTDPGS